MKNKQIKASDNNKPKIMTKVQQLTRESAICFR